MVENAEHGGGQEGHSSQSRPFAVATLERQRRRDAAMALPFVAAVLFASPLLDVVARAGLVAGIPFAALYIFAAWFGLVAIIARLGRGLIEDSET